MAVEQLVRAAWVIDAAGDTGNRGDVEDAYDALGRAAADVEKVFAADDGRRGDDRQAGRVGGRASCDARLRCSPAQPVERAQAGHVEVHLHRGRVSDRQPSTAARAMRRAASRRCRC